MAEVEAGKHLEHVALNRRKQTSVRARSSGARPRTHLEQDWFHAARQRVHMLLQVLVKVLEDQVQSVLAVDYVVQTAVVGGAA